MSQPALNPQSLSFQDFSVSSSNGGGSSGGAPPSSGSIGSSMLKSGAVMQPTSSGFEDAGASARPAAASGW